LIAPTDSAVLDMQLAGVLVTFQGLINRIIKIMREIKNLAFPVPKNNFQFMSPQINCIFKPWIHIFIQMVRLKLILISDFFTPKRVLTPPTKETM
jgi:hypothetical protein